MTVNEVGRHGTKFQRAQGFTLLEVLVALALLGIAGIVVFQLFSAGTRGIARSEDYVNAEVRAEARMQEVLDRDVGTANSWSEVTADGYRIDVEVSDALQERTAGLPVRLAEIALTIHWKKDGGEKSLTLRTMKTVKNDVKAKVLGHV